MTEAAMFQPLSVEEVATAAVADELARLSPAECLLPDDGDDQPRDLGEGPVGPDRDVGHLPGTEALPGTVVEVDRGVVCGHPHRLGERRPGVDVISGGVYLAAPANQVANELCSTRSYRYRLDL